MKKSIILLCRDLKTLCKKESRGIFTAFISFFLCFTVFFPALSYFINHISLLQDLNYDRCTYALYFSVQPEKEQQSTCFPIEAFDRLFFSDIFPKAMESYDGATFCFYCTEGSVIKQESTIWTPYFGTNSVLIGNGDDVLLEGIWPSSEGAAEVVVSRNSYPNAAIGDEMTVGGCIVSVVGISDKGNHFPYRLMKQYSTKQQGFLPLPFHCTFFRELSQDELVRCREAGIQAESRFSTRRSGFYAEAILTLLVVLAMLLLIVLNMLSLLRYLVNCGRYRYQLLQLCGASGVFLFLDMYIIPFLTGSLGFLSGLCLYYGPVEAFLFQKLGYTSLKPFHCCLSYVCFLLFVFFAALPMMRRLIKAAPSDKRLGGEYEII